MCSVWLHLSVYGVCTWWCVGVLCGDRNCLALHKSCMSWRDEWTRGIFPKFMLVDPLGLGRCMGLTLQTDHIIILPVFIVYPCQKISNMKQIFPNLTKLKNLNRPKLAKLYIYLVKGVYCYFILSKRLLLLVAREESTSGRYTYEYLSKILLSVNCIYI